MENKLTSEFMEETKQGKPVEEPGVLPDEEMDQVVGGVRLPPGQVETPVTGLECPQCHSTDILEITGPYINSKHYCKKCHYCAIKSQSDFIRTGENIGCVARY